MTEYGVVHNVRLTTLGSYLAADAASAATVLTVESAIDFNEYGGELAVAGTTYTYLSADLETDQITLQTGLAAAATEKTRVDVQPLTTEKHATIVLANSEDSIVARVPHSLVERLSDGIRQDGERESVAFELTSTGGEGGEFLVTDILGKASVITGSLFRTAVDGQRVEVSSEPSNEIRFYTGHADEDQPGRLVVSNFDTDGGQVFLTSPVMLPGGGEAQIYLASEGDATPATEVFITAERISFGSAIKAWDSLTFTNATLSGSWTNLGGVWPPTGYKKDADGYVHVAIAATWPGGGPPSNMFTLPVGMHPSAAYPLVGEGNQAHARATVLDTGVVQFNVGSTSAVLINARFPSSDIR